MSLKLWLQSANKLAKQGLSKQQVIDKIGDPPGKITSNGNGGWQRRTGNLKGQRKRRRNFDQTSTDVAYSEVKKSNNTKRQINREAKMYGLETMQTEHLADQDDAKSISAGAPGDPTNRLDVKTSDARFKDSVKQKLGKKGFAVVNNAAEESIKAIPKQFFDPMADPNTLPGIDLKTPADLDIVDAQFQRSSLFGRGDNAMSSVIYGSLDAAASRGGPVVEAGVDAFDALVDEPVRQSTGKGVFDQIPNGTKEERRAENTKTNADLKKNNGHNGNGYGHSISNEIAYISKKLSKGKLPYNGD